MEFDLGPVKLRKPRPDDAQGFITICAEKETMKYYGVSGAGITTPEQAIDQINWCLWLFENHGGRWIITESGKDEYIGDIGFHNYQADHHKTEIGYRLKQAYWGRGIISRCIRALLGYGFESLGYNRVEALVDTRNTASGRVLLKNGFLCEGTLREYEFEHGHYVDMNLFAILKRDYSLGE